MHCPKHRYADILAENGIAKTDNTNGIDMHRANESKLVIRVARPSDAEAICRVQHAAVRRIPEGAPAEIVNVWSGACSPEVIRRDVVHGVVGFVAVVGNEVAGFAVLAGNTVRVVCVHPEHAGIGLGSALLAKLEQEALRRGVRALRLSASARAKSFYQARGYQVVRGGSRQLPLDSDLPCMEMAKIIAS